MLLPLSTTSALVIVGASGAAYAAHTHHAPASAAAHRLQSSSRSVNDDPNYTLTFHLSSPGLTDLDERVHHLAYIESASTWLSNKELKSYLAPHPTHTHNVRSWLTSHNITGAQWSSHGDRVTFNTTHSVVEGAFQAPLAEYQLGRSRAWRTASYTIPDNLEGVESITPLTSFLQPRKQRTHVLKHFDPHQSRLAAAQAAQDQNGCSDTYVTIECLRKHYGSYDFQPNKKGNETDLLIVGFGNDEAFNSTDLQSFLKEFRPDQANYTVETKTMGVQDAKGPGGAETMLDLELAVGIAGPLKVDFLLASDNGDDPFLNPLQKVLDWESKPGVISVSYGPAEASMTPDDAQRWHKTSLALASQGHTVVFASGDSGIDQDLHSCKNGIRPPWPTTESILVVGGTAGFQPEHAMNPLTDPQQNVAVWSGAGWSNLNRVPSWQKDISQSYLDSLSKNVTGYVNSTGRAITDVSAMGEAITVLFQGQTQSVAGTSASAPIWAAHLALVNSALRAKGKKNVGFIHSRLYASGLSSGAVNDIQHGKTCGCPDVQLCFPSQKGWDPATGLGTPNFQGLLKFFGAN